ncbi:MAG: hypothetical protein ABIR52_12830 [Casimicrobiaceae bacterium]
MPRETFRARTARSYLAFRQAHRDDIATNEPKIAAASAVARESFDHQFAQVRAGKVSMLDLESLHKEATQRCKVVETEWLAPRAAPK